MLYSFSWPIEGSLVFGNSRPTAVIPKVWTKHPWWTEGTAVGLIAFVLKFVPVAGTLSTKQEFGKCC